jgi:hypothetical protein
MYPHLSYHSAPIYRYPRRHPAFLPLTTPLASRPPALILSHLKSTLSSRPKQALSCIKDTLIAASVWPCLPPSNSNQSTSYLHTCQKFVCHHDNICSYFLVLVMSFFLSLLEPGDVFNSTLVAPNSYFACTTLIEDLIQYGGKMLEMKTLSTMNHHYHLLN